MKSLFNITAEALEIASALEEGELTPELENALAINQAELQNKAFNYAQVVRSIEGDISIIDEEIKRLQALKMAKRNAIDRMKESVSNAMQLYGFEKLKSPTLTLSLRKSESVDVVNVEQLQNIYKVQKITVAPDKIKIKEVIKSGGNVEGAVLNVNYNLQIK
jgi:hypothetical protein